MDYTMIVPVTSEKYNNLFAEATEFLRSIGKLSEDEAITSLNSYYGHMKTFYDNQAYKFIMMPLESVGEEVFKINLNERKIEVPKLFATVGGVQADQMAELITFSADRFFDYMDLANTLIFVQWQLPDEGKTTGATQILIKDIGADGKLRFAWPLHKGLTKYSGDLRFSVRFFCLNDEQELAYALNTLDEKIVIRPALNPDDIGIKEGELRDLFNAAIRNSQYTSAGSIPPVDPYFGAPGMDLTIANEDDFVRIASEFSYAKPVQIARLGEDDSLKMRAQAITGDAGNLYYYWKFKEDSADAVWKYLQMKGGKPVKSAVELLNADIPVVNGVPKLDLREKYFTADGSRYTSNEVPVDDKGAYDGSLREQYAYYEIPALEEGAANVDVVGTYALVAVNEVDGKEATVWSSYCYLPGPADIAFVEDNMFTAVVENGAIKSLSANIVNDANAPMVKFNWFRSVSDKDTAIAMAASEGVDYEQEKTQAVDMTKALTPGWYAAKAYANLNRKTKVGGTPEAFTIYADPTITSVECEGENFYILAKGEVITDPFAVAVSVAAPEIEGIDVALYKNLKFEWFYTMADANDYKAIDEKMISETDHTKRVKSFDPATGKLVVRAIDPGKLVQYKCKITNILGDKEDSKEIDGFLVQTNK